MTAFGYFLWVICCENITTAGFIRICVFQILMSPSWFMGEAQRAAWQPQENGLVQSDISATSSMFRHLQVMAVTTASVFT